MTAIVINDLTTGDIEGLGVFDKLMASMKAHLESEFDKNRIKGPEYSTVYLGALNAVLGASMQFLLSKEKAGLEAELIAAQIELTKQQAENAKIEKEVLEAQVCKLKAEYDLTVNTNTKTTQEITLLTQKTATERAQIQALGVDPDSVVGKQKALYQAQTDGFQRDAEQKAAKLLVDTWSARRMSDEGTVADGINMLNDATIGRAVQKVLAGVNA